MAIEDTYEAKMAQWSDALQDARARDTAMVREHVALAIQKSPAAFGLSKAEAKRMGPAAIGRMADGITAALENTNLMLLERPRPDQHVDPYLWWKQTWNLFRGIGHKPSMLFSRSIYVALTRYPYFDFSDMDWNVELDSDDDAPTMPGLRVVK